MDVDLTFEHIEEKELLLQEKREDKRDFEGSQLGLRSDMYVVDSAIDEYSYQFNLNLSIALTEGEPDEVVTEFTDFSCMHCKKLCKPKGGLTRHINCGSIMKPEILSIWDKTEWGVFH